MGGCDFSNEGKGRNVRDVFHNLVDSAKHEYGHGGYTGSIAEKNGFTIIPQPTQADLREVLKRDLEYAERSIQISNADIAKNKASPSACGLQYATASLLRAQERKRLLESQLASTTIPGTKELLRDYADMYEDKHPNEKWGPAYCLVLKEVQPVVPMGKAKALTLAKKKWGETAEVKVECERANKSNGRTKTYRASVTAECAMDSYFGKDAKATRVVATGKHTDEKTALGMLFVEDGEFLFFGVASE